MQQIYYWSFLAFGRSHKDFLSVDVESEMNKEKKLVKNIMYYWDLQRNLHLV